MEKIAKVSYGGVGEEGLSDKNIKRLCNFRKSKEKLRMPGI